MGGIGSGNHGGRLTVENGLMLDLNQLIRQGIVRPEGTGAGSIVWSETAGGRRREMACIGYEADMDEESGWIRLRYTTTSSRSGQKTHHDYRVELTATAQPFGGRRWWWICPSRRRLVAKLYMPAGGGVFASRKAHRLAYRSQRQSPYDRTISRAFKLRRRLGSTGALWDAIDKPKGMRWATFDRKMDQVEAAEAVCNGNLLHFVQRLVLKP
jgi:hypothetical protein